jgi:hypothetical protein
MQFVLVGGPRSPRCSTVRMAVEGAHPGCMALTQTGEKRSSWGCRCRWHRRMNSAMKVEATSTHMLTATTPLNLAIAPRHSFSSIPTQVVLRNSRTTRSFRAHRDLHWWWSVMVLAWRYPYIDAMPTLPNPSVNFPEWWIVNALSASAVDIVSWCSSWRGSDSNNQVERLSNFQVFPFPLIDGFAVISLRLTIQVWQLHFANSNGWTRAEQNWTSSGFLRFNFSLDRIELVVLA